ncbi:hypothetical protein [Staphylococcus phage vB_SepM_ phiIPLA-C1C]|uniref:Uncharacterized protein n=1 Tax=Staphylococcus phage vB_SepM_ phiIPLA-C1C TaxID=1572704 RepID=A0A0D3MWE9_9CAUD|nr:virion structural protein [Staphylococcus phage phiIPLA-C1C]AJA42217.1 hypothetical protein [Staphylococcus phage phiIPLA-C1C]
MAFSYTDLKETDRLKDLYPKVNDIGHYLIGLEENIEGTGNIETYDSVDFNNVTSKVSKSGTYYFTRTTNQPEDVNHNGYVVLYVRNKSFYKIYFSPFNTNELYVKTNNNGTLTDWSKFKLEDDDFFDEGNTVDIKRLDKSTTQFATLLNPPKEDLNTGWLDYKESKEGKSAILEFNPINSTSTFTKMRRLPEQEQNNNLLRDSLFVHPETDYHNVKTDNWENPPFWGYSDNAKKSSIKFRGENVVQVDDGSNKYPTVMSKRFKMGKQLSVGDTVTVSVYLKVNDPSLFKDNLAYFELAGYDDVDTSINPYTGGRREVTADELSTEWKKYSFTFSIPEYTQGASGVKTNYVSLLLRMNCSKSGTNNGAIVYYAMPKLEKGSKVTPFITHEKDVKQYDEIWTNWNELVPKDRLKNYTTVDTDNDSYFKYRFWKDEVGDTSFKDLLLGLPQGLHTIYAQNGIKDLPGTESLRGTVLVDYSKGDLTNSNKFITSNLMTLSGRTYKLTFNGTTWNVPLGTENSFLLWTGEADLSDSSINMTFKDSIKNYDYVEITFYFDASGSYTTERLDLTVPGLSNFYIRGMNLANSSTSTSIDFYEGEIDLVSDTMAKPAMSKKIKIRDGVSSVEGFNTKGHIIVYNIVGIKKL